MAGERLAVVTNLPSPYRAHLFGALHRELRERDAHLDVRFMARGASYRNWRYEPEADEFPSRVAWGVHPGRGLTYFHLNPGAMTSLLASPPTWLMLGGSWWVPTVAGLTAGARLARRGTPLIFWAEANLAASRRSGGPAAWARRAVLGRFEAFAVPGQIAREALRVWGVAGSKPMLPLPNVVDEAVYRDHVDGLRTDRAGLRTRLGIAEGELAVLWPARLHEPTKGIRNFLDAVVDDMPDHVRILVAGDGPDAAPLATWLSERGRGKVRLLGWQGQEQMTELYAASDAFLLPSLADPNPLSVIEALWAGLPALISDRCGNHPEAVEHGANGWVVDPSSAESMRAAWSDLAGRSVDALAAMGQRSRFNADERFETTGVVRRFVDSLMVLDRS